MKTDIDTALEGVKQVIAAGEKAANGLRISDNTASFNARLGKAIHSFEQIRKHSTTDRFLVVYSEDNRHLYEVTEEDFNRVINAARNQVIENDEDFIQKAANNRQNLSLLVAEVERLRDISRLEERTGRTVEDCLRDTALQLRELTEAKAQIEKLREALRTINNARHADNAVSRFVPDRTDDAITEAEKEFKLTYFAETEAK